jgi:hypothetical protein
MTCADREPLSTNIASQEGIVCGEDRSAAPLIQRLPVNVLLDGDSPRLSGVNHAHVARLTECGASLPPILVHRGTMRVIDGTHRLHAARRNKRESIETIFRAGRMQSGFLC